MGDTKPRQTKESQRVRDILRGVVTEDFKGNQSHAARVLNLTQATINFVLNGDRLPDRKVVDALADYLHRATDDIRGRLPRFCELEGWTEALAEAQRLYPRVPPAAFKAVGNLMGEGPPGEITPAVIGQMAQGWYASAPDEERIRARRERAEAEMAEEDTNKSSNGRKSPRT